MLQFVYCILIIDPITLEQIDRLEFYSEQDMDKRFDELTPPNIHIATITCFLIH